MKSSSASAVSVDRLELRNRLLAAARGDLGLLALELDVRHQPLEWAPIVLAAAHAPVRTSSLARTLARSEPRMRAIISAMSAAGWLAPVGDRRGRYYVAGAQVGGLGLRSPELMNRLRRGEPGRTGE